MDIFLNSLCSVPTAVALISRPKLGGAPGRHYGVALLGEFDACYTVVDLQRERGFREQSIDEFRGGYQLQTDLLVNEPLSVCAAMERLREAVSPTASQPRIASTSHGSLRSASEGAAKWVSSLP